MGEEFFKRLVAQHVCRDTSGNAAVRLQRNIEARKEKIDHRKISRKSKVQKHRRSINDKLYGNFLKNL